MKKCEHDCHVVCHFCTFLDIERDRDGDLTGEGWCNIKKEYRDLGSGCDEFVCMNIDKEERVREAKEDVSNDAEDRN